MVVAVAVAALALTCVDPAMLLDPVSAVVVAHVADPVGVAALAVVRPAKLCRVIHMFQTKIA